MAKLSVVKGAQSVLVRIFVQDSTSTTGAGKTGLVAASFTGTKCYVARDDDGNAAGTAVSLTDATRGTWSSGGIKEKDSTNMPGVYEFGLTNASLLTGSRSCTYYFGGTGLVPELLEIELTGPDNQDGVHFGLTCLPNTAVTTNGSLITSGSGTAQLTVSGGKAAATMGSSDYSGNTVQTGDAYARLGAPAGASIEADIAAIKSDTSSVKTATNTGVAPGASGGLLISGPNSGTTTLAALTVTGTATISDGIVVARSSSNSDAVKFTGSGTGNGLTLLSGSGVTGDGLKATSQATNGNGFELVGNGSGYDLKANVNGIQGNISGTLTTVTTATTATNLTNLPSIPSNWITAAGINAAALNGKGDWALASNLTGDPYAYLTTNVGANGANLTGTSIAHQTLSSTSSLDFQNATSLGYIVRNGIPSAANIAQNVWTDTGDQGTAGSLGLLIATNLNATVSSRLASSGYTAPLTSTTTAQAVWNAVASSYNTAGSMGAYAQAGGNPWATNITTGYTSGQAGYILNGFSGATDPLTNPVPGSYAPGTAGNEIAAIYSLLAAGPINVFSRTAQGGPISFAQGDDLVAANGTAITGRVGWGGSTLSGATITFSLIAASDYAQGNNNIALTASGSGSLSAGVVTYTIELSAAQTAALNSSPPQPGRNYMYAIRITDASTKLTTLILGPCTVQKAN